MVSTVAAWTAPPPMVMPAAAATARNGNLRHFEIDPDGMGTPPAHSDKAVIVKQEQDKRVQTIRAAECFSLAKAFLETSKSRLPACSRSSLVRIRETRTACEDTPGAAPVYF